MAAIMSLPNTAASVRGPEDEDFVMDTRTPSPVGATVNNSSVSDSEGTKSEQRQYKPDLSSEVAMLSTKLINAINYQTNLDDSLQATRHELEQTQSQLRDERAAKQRIETDIAEGVLVKKAQVDETIARLRAELAVERLKRETAEKQKKQTDGELENLTSALFEEANTMVAAARRDTEHAERRNSQLRSQLQDTEFMLASQQQQLRDLQVTVERLEHNTSETHDPSVPASPITNTAIATWTSLGDHSDPSNVPPDHPLHFAQLLVPVMRTDICAYSEFFELLSLAKKAATPQSRPESRNVSQPPQTHHGASALSAFNSSPSLPGAFSFSSANSSPSSAALANPPPALKESKFYKRMLLEDIEPTLRLDLAPGLSFLTRRSVMSSLLSGSLAVEPFVPTNYKFYAPVFACALCGESRKQEPYIRKHRFRISESEDSQRYPLCDYCLGRLRATGDFFGFLRTVKDGHWRCENEEDERCAWEEAVRLRERMFWARLGGGVVPASSRREHSETAAVQANEDGGNQVAADVSQVNDSADSSVVIEKADFASDEKEKRKMSVEVLKVPEATTPPAQTPVLQGSDASESIDTVEQEPQLEEPEVVAGAEVTNTTDPVAPDNVVTNDETEVRLAEHRPQRLGWDNGPDVNSAPRSRLSYHMPRELKLDNPPERPSTAPGNRKPSAVLDRVRAMEARSGTDGKES